MEFMTANNAKVVIGPAAFKDAMALKSAITKEIANSDLDFDFEKEINVGDFAKIALMIDSSSEVNKALFDCLSRCTYKGHKITEATFEDVEARKDYYEICIACVKENLLPFFESLHLKLKPFLDQLPVQAKNSLNSK